MNNPQKKDEHNITKEVNEMYNCYLEVEDFLGHKNFEFIMGYSECDTKRKLELPYQKFITDYNTSENRLYAISAIDEMFLLEEVEQMDSYFSKHPQVKFRYEPAELPINGNMFPLDWKYTGGILSLYDFVEYDGNNQLNFGVCCYYDVYQV